MENTNDRNPEGHYLRISVGGQSQEMRFSDIWVDKIDATNRTVQVRSAHPIVCFSVRPSSNAHQSDVVDEAEDMELLPPPPPCVVKSPLSQWN